MQLTILIGFPLFLYSVLGERIVGQNLCSDLCRFVVCEKLTNCSTGQMLRKASGCKCCDVCSDQYDGELSSCEKVRTTLENRIWENNDYEEKLWKPACDDEGYFKPVQHKRGRYICLSNEGKIIFGQGETGLTEKMTCGCSLYKETLKKGKIIEEYQTQPQEHCTATGNFDTLQCIGDLCYCANEKTGNVESRMVKMTHIDKLPCYRDDFDEGYLKPCEKELQRSLRHRFLFFLKGLEVLEVEQMECNYDGTFSPTQCNNNKCVCTDKYGVGIDNYYKEKEPKDKLSMTCDCARDSSKSTLSQSPHLKCRENGNYYHLQCFDESDCFCVDRDGDVISKSLNESKSKEDFCASLYTDLWMP